MKINVTQFERSIVRIESDDKKVLSKMLLALMDCPEDGTAALVIESHFLESLYVGKFLNIDDYLLRIIEA
jgi:hypothetical protein